MKKNKKKEVLAKSNSIISHLKDESTIIPKDDPDNLKTFLNCSYKPKQIKKSIINLEIKNYVEKNLKNLKENFNKEYRKYYNKINNSYTIEYNVLYLTKEYIVLTCSESKCKSKAYIKLLTEKEDGFPDPDGNIILNKTNNNLFISDEHKIDLFLHKSYIKEYIKINFTNLTKNDIFKDIYGNKYLKEYCKYYFIKNPDESTNNALNNLAFKFNINYENEEIKNLLKCIKIGKQYQYDNKDLLEYYTFNIEDIKDNNNLKIAKAYPYCYENKRKNLWIILTDDMKKNLINYKINSNSNKFAITQYFADITYKCVPRNKYRYKLFVLCGFDIIKNKSVICTFALIMDETTETFNFLFNKLKDLYKFNPIILTCDFQISLRSSLKNIFPNIKIYPCYYHFIRSIRKNLLKRFIKNKNNIEIFYDMLSNYRILPFIPIENNVLFDFLELIKKKYKDNENFKDLNEFFSYFKLQWTKKCQYSDWNVYNISMQCMEEKNIDKLFFTNNIMESINSRLNYNLIKNKNNNVNQFNMKLNEIINLYNSANKYVPPIFSKTKAIANFIYYNKNFIEKIHLITHKELKEIFKGYKKTVIPNNKLEELLDELSDSLYEIENSEEFNTDNDKKLIDKQANIDKKDSNYIDNEKHTDIMNININKEKEYLKIEQDDTNNNNIKKNFKDKDNKNNKAKKRKNDGYNFNNINDNPQTFELNMYYYNQSINYFEYKIQYINKIKEHIIENKLEDTYDIKKINNFINDFYCIKEKLINNQQESINFSITLNDLKNNYKYYLEYFILI